MKAVNDMTKNEKFVTRDEKYTFAYMAYLTSVAFITSLLLIMMCGGRYDSDYIASVFECVIINAVSWRLMRFYSI